MKKPEFLKTSYLKRKIKELIIGIFLLDIKIKKNKKEDKKEKVLIVAYCALGDNAVQCKTIEILTETYGKDEVWILCREKWKMLYELQEYKNILTDEPSANIFYKIKLYRKINEMNFSKIITLNHGKIADSVQFLYVKDKYDMSDNVEYILEKQVILLKKVLQKDYSIEEIRPYLNKYFPEIKYRNLICIAVGASDKAKIMNYETMKKIIVNLLDIFKNKDIILLGVGKKEEAYAKKLLEEIKNNSLKSYVNKISLIETIEYINSADLFIGGDSGLMNIAFALQKKIICLHWYKGKHLWEHPFDNVKIIKGKGGKEYSNKKYGTETLNSITPEQIQKAIRDLKIL